MPNYSYLAASNSQGNVRLYKLTGSTFEALDNPDFQPSDDGANLTYSADFSSDAEYLAISCNAAPRIYIYKKDGDTFFKLPDPATIPSGTVTCAKFDPSSEFLAMSRNGGMSIYQRSADTFTLMSNPVGAITANGSSCAWNSEGSILAVCSFLEQPYLFSRSGSVFTKLSFPASSLPIYARAMAFSPLQDLLVCAHNGSPYLSVSSVSGSVHTLLSNPASVPSLPARAVAFNAAGTLVAVGADDGLYLYSVSGTTLTRVSNPSGAPTSIRAVAFSEDDSVLSVGFAESPYVKTYSVSGSTLTEITSPTVPSFEVTALDYSSSFNSDPQPGDVVADKSMVLTNQNAVLAMQTAVDAMTDILPDGLPVYYENQPAWQQPSNKPWARLSVIFTASENVAVGAGSAWVRRSGLIVLDVFTPKGTSSNLNLTICERLVDSFENKQLGNIKTFAANTAKIEDDPWLGYQVNVNFYVEGF